MVIALKYAASGLWRWLTRSGGWKPALVALTAIALASYVMVLRGNLDNARGSLKETTERAEAAEGEALLLRRSRAADGAAITVSTNERARVARLTRGLRIKTDEATKASPAWADAPVPRDVADLLR